jgi:hypothetical protein
MNTKKSKDILIIVIVLIVIGTLGYWLVNKEPVATQIPIVAPVVSLKLEYVNDQYGFSITLPSSWKGYTTVSESWTGNLIDSPNSSSINGPKLLIRSPLWTKEIPRQDIPIMIFTPDQWNLIGQEKLSVGAAPIGPSELGRNTKYIFALPARYNFSYLPGFEEVQQIIDSKSFKGI